MQEGTILYKIPVSELLDLPVSYPLRELIADRAEEAGIKAGLIAPDDDSYYDDCYIQVEIEDDQAVARLVACEPSEVPAASDGDDPGEHFMDGDGRPSERDIYDDMHDI